MGHSVLLLNGDFLPLDTISVERAMILLLSEKVEMIHAKVGKYISTIKHKFAFPEVVRLKFYVYIKRREMAPTKANIFLRDNYTCQYCGCTDKKSLTIDHIHPVSKGGDSSEKNLCVACLKCNNLKGNKSLEEFLKETGYTYKRSKNNLSHLKNLQDLSFDKNLESWKPYLFIV